MYSLPVVLHNSNNIIVRDSIYVDYTVHVSRRLSQPMLTDLLSMEISAKACSGNHTGWGGGGGGGVGSM